MEFNRLEYHFQQAGVKPQVVIDIGANKGQWFTEFRKRFKCNMHLFEADNDNKELLTDTVSKINGQCGYSNTIVTIALLGSEIGKEISFYKTKGNNNTGNSTYLENSCYFLDHEIERLKTVTLDELIGYSYEKIDLIKLDVQGAELDILKGAREKVLLKCDLILMEVAFLQYNKGAPLAYEVFKFMDSIGFQSIDILEKHHFGHDMIQADFLFARKDSVYVKDKFGY